MYFNVDFNVLFKMKKCICCRVNSTYNDFSFFIPQVAPTSLVGQGKRIGISTT